MPFLKQSKSKQYLVSVSLALAVALLCFGLSGYVSYHTAALLLLVTVSVVATLYDIYPVLSAAALSALILNFFFIPPLYTFHIYTPEDLLMLVSFFIIAVVNAVFTFRIRREERKVRERASRRETLKLYNTLFNSLSHELKTPIATVIGAADMLKDNPDLSDKNRRELLYEIGLAGQRLNSQVENLLNMGRLESGMLTLKRDWCDVQELLHSVIKEVWDNCHSISIDENASTPLVKLDQGLVRQALANVVQNALIYTPAGSEIRLSAQYENEVCIITIADNGPGIPEAALRQLFDKFFRLPDTKAGGTGLGLSIAKGFTEAHGGNIAAENADGGGAVFTLAIPAEANYLNRLKNE